MDDNSKVYLETIKEDVEEKENSLFEPITSGRIIHKTKDFFKTSFNQIGTFSNEIISSIKNLDNAPDEFEVEFSVKFSADAGIIISSISSEATLKVKFKWDKSKRKEI